MLTKDEKRVFYRVGLVEDVVRVDGEWVKMYFPTLDEVELNTKELVEFCDDKSQRKELYNDYFYAILQLSELFRQQADFLRKKYELHALMGRTEKTGNPGKIKE